MEYFKKGDAARAWARVRPYYEESIRQFPYYVLSYVGLRRVEVFGGHYAEAIPALEKSIQEGSKLRGAVDIGI